MPLKTSLPQYPHLFRIHQEFVTTPPVYPAETIASELSRIGVRQRLKAGATVAVAVGSRGITDIAAIVKCILAELKAMGAAPFILPAMGSHGGATATGQKEVLRKLGISPKSMGFPVRATMEVVQLGTLSAPGTVVPLFMNKLAWKADHVVVVNRIKKHSAFGGDFGSGMMKMIAIGLGNHIGAGIYHKAFVSLGYPPVIRPAAQHILETGKILFGVGIVENGFRNTAAITVAPADELIKTEIALMKQANRYMPRLPVDEIDILLIDEMGKDIHGSGLDPNVHGRHYGLSEKTAAGIRIKRIIVCDLTDNSLGNAMGIGYADFVTQRLMDKIDLKTTHINAITSMGPEDVRIPITLETEREAIDAALSTIGLKTPENAKLVWLKNTSELQEFIVTEPCLAALQKQPDIVRLENLGRLTFDSEGNLIKRWAKDPPGGRKPLQG